MLNKSPKALVDLPVKKELKDTTSGFKWNGLSIFNMALIKVFRGFLIPKILTSVAEYGLYSSINVFTRYLNFSDFGAKEYLMKHLTHVHLNEGYEAEKRIINETINFILLSFVLVIIYLGIYSFLFSGENADFYKVSLLLLIPITMLARGKDILVGVAVCRQDYSKVAKIQIMMDLTSLVFTVAGVYFYGALGGVYALLATHLFIFIMAYNKVRIDFEFNLNFGLIKNLRKYWKLFSAFIVENINNTIDLVFILAIFSTADFGLYSFGAVFSWVMVAVSGIFNASLQPKIMSYIKVGQEKLDKIVHLTQFTFTLACLAILPFLQLSIFLLISLFLTKFQGGLDIYFLIVISGVIRSSSILLKQMYIAKSKEKLYIKLMTANIFISAGAYYAFSLMGGSIHELINLVLLVDLCVFLLLYIPLYSAKFKLFFYLNLFLLGLAYSFAQIVKYLFAYSVFNLTEFLISGSILIIGMVSIVGMIAYLNRHHIKELIKA